MASLGDRVVRNYSPVGTARASGPNVGSGQSLAPHCLCLLPPREIVLRGWGILLHPDQVPSQGHIKMQIPSSSQHAGWRGFWGGGAGSARPVVPGSEGMLTGERQRHQEWVSLPATVCGSPSHCPDEEVEARSLSGIRRGGLGPRSLTPALLFALWPPQKGAA